MQGVNTRAAAWSVTTNTRLFMCVSYLQDVIYFKTQNQLKIIRNSLSLLCLERLPCLWCSQFRIIKNHGASYQQQNKLPRAPGMHAARITVASKKLPKGHGALLNSTVTSSDVQLPVQSGQTQALDHKRSRHFCHVSYNNILRVINWKLSTSEESSYMQASETLSVTLIISSIHIFSSYRAVNTLRPGYTKKSVNAV
jgi:hypothetical protein